MTRSTLQLSQATNRYRWQIVSRILAATVGGYAVANISAILLSFILPMSRSEAVMTSLLLSFAIYTLAILWVFAVKSVLKAWLGLVIPSVLLGALALLVKLVEAA